MLEHLDACCVDASMWVVLQIQALIVSGSYMREEVRGCESSFHAHVWQVATCFLWTLLNTSKPLHV
jgi:hypothetical protein